MAKLNKGFSYIIFLGLVLIIATLIASFNYVSIRLKRMQKLDLAKIQADLYAQSGMEYHKLQPYLPPNDLPKVTRSVLLAAPGKTINLKFGGFKIIYDNNTHYYLGYYGKDINKAKCLTVLQKREGKVHLWEN